MPDEESSRIYVLEDDAQILESLCEVLAAAGYAVEGSRDARKALQRLRAEGPAIDLIILDLMMPGMSGWEFRTIQKADPALAEIPVLAISADTSSKAAAVDAVRFLPKPLRVPEVLSVVERILLERERQRMKARLDETERLASLGTLAAGVGHEISNPLSFTMHNLDVVGAKVSFARRMVDELAAFAALPGLELKLKALSDELKQVAELTETSVLGTERIRSVVRSLQGLARRNDDKRSLVDPHRVLEDSIAMAWNQIRHRAKLVRRFGEVRPLWANETRLGQLFLNLLVNATQAIPEGNQEENEISLTTFAEADQLIVEVKDTGAGIPPSIREHLFDPFFTTKPMDVGTGLGLSVCHSVVTEHGGKLEVESEVGKGSLFRVRLPMTQARASERAESIGGKGNGAAADAATAESRPRESGDGAVESSAAESVAGAQGLANCDDGAGAESSVAVGASAEQGIADAGDGAEKRAVRSEGFRHRVLVVEDEAMVAAVMRQMLEEQHDVVIASRGSEALARLSAGERIDVILCDLMMPNMTGMQFYEEVERRFPSMTSHVVFVTGGAFSYKAEEFLRRVNVPLLIKPFSSAELLEATQRIIDLHSES